MFTHVYICINLRANGYYQITKKLNTKLC